MGTLVTDVEGYTWPGIDAGEPPKCKYSFYQYIDAIRCGNLPLFRMIEEESRAWWFPTLDRGAGAALHFAVDHGQLACVKFLVAERRVPVNQQDRVNGWTALHRCARMAHYRHAPYVAIFEYLLSKGADDSILTLRGWPDMSSGAGYGPPLTVIDVAAEKVMVAAAVLKHVRAFFGRSASVIDQACLNLVLGERVDRRRM